MLELNFQEFEPLDTENWLIPGAYSYNNIRKIVNNVSLSNINIKILQLSDLSKFCFDVEVLFRIIPVRYIWVHALQVFKTVKLQLPTLD